MYVCTYMSGYGQYFSLALIQLQKFPVQKEEFGYGTSYEQSG